MKKLKKKGQTEDFLADLIPSLIIIIIGVFVLSSMHNTNRVAVNNQKRLVNYDLMEKKMITDHLSKMIDVGDKKISLQELISLSYKNEGYKQVLINDLQRTGLAQIEGPVEAIAVMQTQLEAETPKERKECFQLEIIYPEDPNPLKLGGGCDGREQTFYLPTYEGQYLMVKSVTGTTPV